MLLSTRVDRCAYAVFCPRLLSKWPSSDRDEQSHATEPAVGSVFEVKASRAGPLMRDVLHDCKMKTAAAFKDLLCTFPWFENTGTLIDDKNVSAVSTWKEAREFACSSNRWINFKWSIARQMHGQIESKKIDRHEEIEALRRMLARFTCRKFVKDLDKYVLPGSTGTGPSTSAHLAYHVRFDLWIAGHEYILGDKIKPVLFLPVILDWYSKGHFPCGWRGTMIKSDWQGNSLKDLPPGRLRVL